MKEIIQKSFTNSMSYSDYRTLVLELLSRGKSTGSNQSESLLHYSTLNNKRMNRLDKTLKLTNKTLKLLKNIDKKTTWLVLTEGWCGDAAQSLPIINKMANQNERINLRIVLRDENEELMNLFLTNGGKAIPKLIALNENNEVISTWGPRPSTATKMVNSYKAQHGALDDAFKKDLQVWYNQDKGKNTQEDLLGLL